MDPPQQGEDTTELENSTPETSHLLKLPLELRNMIYEDAFLAEHMICIDPAHAYPPEPPLLATCHQIRHEAHEIYYGTSKFAKNIIIMDRIKFKPKHEEGQRRPPCWLTFIGMKRTTWIRTLEVGIARWSDWGYLVWGIRRFGEDRFKRDAAIAFHELLSGLVERGVSLEAIRVQSWELRGQGRDALKGEALNLCQMTLQGVLADMKADTDRVFWDIRRLWTVDQ